MELKRYQARLLHNTAADPRRPYGATEQAILSREAFETARAEIGSWPGYKATPLVALPALATRLGVASLRYKDESERFGLKSFKALGGAYAVLRVLQEHLRAAGRREGLAAADLIAGRHRETVKSLTVAAATDGNHGRSVAWGAQMFGCRCKIYLHSHVSQSREQEIAKYGAEIVRVQGGYDDSVRQCAIDARKNGWFLVADTDSGGGDPAVPRLVMQGYTLMVEEMLGQAGGRPSHVLVQGGVGGLAAAVAGHLWETLGASRPRVIVVEPTKADCIYRSIEAGRPTPVPHEVDTFMACLAAGEISPVAWPILHYGIDDVVTLPDEAAPEAMRLLANGDPPIVSGESGCAAVAGLVAVMLDPEQRTALGLGPASEVVAIGSEGATDAETYERVVGRSAGKVTG